MATPYAGEIRMFAGNFAPAGWMFCEGQILSISQYTTLFSLIGTTYGGDGQATFALPDLRGRVPVHFGDDPVLGEWGGQEEVTLLHTQMPGHSHVPVGSSTTATRALPGGAYLATSALIRPYAVETPDTMLDPGAITVRGGSQPHDNMQPFLCINFIISLEGTFPNRS